jgi:TnpA family transposase
MRVEKNFVDSHGQSEVAFAFCHLLGLVKLMPRLKRIKYERLYLPDKEMSNQFPNLAGVLTRPLRWDLLLDFERLLGLITASLPLAHEMSISLKVGGLSPSVQMLRLG